MHAFCDQAQNENNKWYFGINAGLDFMTSPPTPLTGSMATSEGCASVADAAGNLLFYTDGSTIWDQNHNVMPNGTGLGGNPSTTQSSIIVKQPGNSTIYFVFSLDVYSNSGDLRYSIVDMSLATGLGSVTVNNILISTSNSEKLTSVKHCNNTDFWVLCCPTATQNPGIGIVNAYLVSSAGVNMFPVVSTLPGLITGAGGNLKTSPNGKK